MRIYQHAALHQRIVSNGNVAAWRIMKKAARRKAAGERRNSNSKTIILASGEKSNG